MDHLKSVGMEIKVKLSLCLNTLPRRHMKDWRHAYAFLIFTPAAGEKTCFASLSGIYAASPPFP
jgi:hypothetical protein